MTADNSDCDNYSLFLNAIRDHDEKRVEALVQRGIFLKKDSANSEVICPLELAISLKNLRIVRILLHHGARISAKIRSFNQTALHYAVITRQRAMVLELLRHEVDWQARDEKGANVLHMVFELGQVDFQRKSNGMLQRKSSPSKQALEQKVLDILELFVVLNADVDARTDSGETALRLALREGMLRAAEYLVAHGANVNARDYEGNSLVYLLVEDEWREQQRRARGGEPAPAQDRESSLDWLLGRGASANCVNGQAVSPIQLAIERRLKGMLLILLDHIDVNYVNGRGETWLHVFLETDGRWKASLSSSELDDIVEDLLEMGAPVDVADCYGSTPLHLAALHRKSRLVSRMLERFGNVSACDGLGRTALHLLADRCLDDAGGHIAGYAELARRLVAKGADPARPSKDGLSAVQLAAKHRHPQMLWLFKESGADFGVRTSGGEGLLHLAAKRFGRLGDGLADKLAVEMLVSQGCDVNARSRSGATPLHVAALYGNAPVARCLLKHGARPDCREDLAGATPLHLAASEELLELLAARGAGLDAADAAGRTALHLAVARGRAGLARRLLDLGADAHCREAGRRRLAPLHLAVLQRSEPLVRLLVGHGADPDLPTARGGSSALHLALEQADGAGVARCLVGLGADVNRADARDRSRPLHAAVRAGDEGLVALLLERGADVDARQAFGETPLHVAVRYLGRAGPGLAGLLLRAGARLDVADAAGRTALQCAIECDCSGAVALLLQFGANVNEAFGRDLFARMTGNCDMACHVIEHLVKLEALELPIDEFQSSIDKRTQQFERLRDKCREEVARLKAYSIDERSSIFDLLHMSPIRRFVCINASGFSPSRVEAHFPKYHGFVWRSYHEALERKFLLSTALDYWYLLTEISLPSICLDYILGFLDNRSLKNMIEAAEAIQLDEIC